MGYILQMFPCRFAFCKYKVGVDINVEKRTVAPIKPEPEMLVEEVVLKKSTEILFYIILSHHNYTGVVLDK